MTSHMNIKVDPMVLLQVHTRARTTTTRDIFVLLLIPPKLRLAMSSKST